MALSAKKTKEEVVEAVNKAVEGASHVKQELLEKKEHVKETTALAPTLNKAVSEKEDFKRGTPAVVTPMIQVGDELGRNYVRPVKEDNAKGVDAPEI